MLERKAYGSSKLFKILSALVFCPQVCLYEGVGTGTEPLELELYDLELYVGAGNEQFPLLEQSGLLPVEPSLQPPQTVLKQMLKHLWRRI